MNNALIPAGIVVNVVIWNRDAELMPLLTGGALILAALWFNQTWVKRRVAVQRDAAQRSQ